MLLSWNEENYCNSLWTICSSLCFPWDFRLANFIAICWVCIYIQWFIYYSFVRRSYKITWYLAESNLTLFWGNMIDFNVILKFQKFAVVSVIECLSTVTNSCVERLGGSLEEIRNWEQGSSFLNNSEFSLTWWLTRNALPLCDWAFKMGLEVMSDCLCCDRGVKETALHAFYYCEQINQFWSHIREWTARIDFKQFLLLNVGYVVDNGVPPWKGEKRVVFLGILRVARMVVWTTRKKELYDGANFSHRGLILFFRYQLSDKIRCERKGLDCIIFDKRCVHAENLFVRRGSTLKSSFPPPSANGSDSLGLSEPNPGWVDISLLPLRTWQVKRCVSCPCHLVCRIQGLSSNLFSYLNLIASNP